MLIQRKKRKEFLINAFQCLTNLPNQLLWQMRRPNGSNNVPKANYITYFGYKWSLSQKTVSYTSLPTAWLLELGRAKTANVHFSSRKFFWVHSKNFRYIDDMTRLGIKETQRWVLKPLSWLEPTPQSIMDTKKLKTKKMYISGFRTSWFNGVATVIEIL